MVSRFNRGTILGLLLVAGTCAGSVADDVRRNVLFIAVDDLNHWVGHLHRNEQTITPNVDRLASWGVSFSRAYCAAPACNPSRAALMSGMRPSTTGVYHNPNDYRPHIPSDRTLNVWFRKHGYRVTGAGKIYHGRFERFGDWDDYLKRPKVKSAGFYSKSNHNGITYSVLKGGDDTVADYFTVNYCIDALQQPPKDQPFFLACGIFRPHMPWSVPKKYFDMHPLDQIELPPYREDDLQDLPPPGVQTARPNGDHKAIRKAGAWKEAIQAYLASVTYADAQLGRLLDAFEQSAAQDNTVIVLWGDHGWHLGEKHHWRKFALWEEATRAPLIWVAPQIAAKDVICETPVDFMGVFPTVCELAGLPLPDHLDGRSLVPLLKDPQAKWDQPAITTHGRNRHAVRTERYRYIRYDDGSEELYDHNNDPYEWTNLASRPESKAICEQLQRHLPQVNVPEVAKAQR